jgi:hypothetical protein
VTSAAIAGATAAAAYLEAKYHIKKDIVSVYRLKKSEKVVQKAGTCYIFITGKKLSVRFQE